MQEEQRGRVQGRGWPGAVLPVDKAAPSFQEAHSLGRHIRPLEPLGVSEPHSPRDLGESQGFGVLAWGFKPCVTPGSVTPM